MRASNAGALLNAQVCIAIKQKDSHRQPVFKLTSGIESKHRFLKDFARTYQ
ncbi:hypothetical protein [Prochlorococcus marinus]|uniref:hypothetical protein n=1 Tax=Prochlorococcus TaxID=1218 RepID=UPI000AF24C40|nr:hypothetical protein [Prochlorococcus marinus]